MNTAQLSLDQAPPYAVPLRFFLTAPLFGAGAALVLLGYGPEALATRWTPAVLAATHLMTLGFATMVMGGALMQLLPVLVGARVARPELASRLVHGALTPGVLALGAGFLSGWRPLFWAALALLPAALLLLVAIAAMALRRSQSMHAMPRAMRLALLALVITVLLGVYLALLRSGVPVFGAHRFTGAHLAWGLLGWIGLLVMVVACQVVPMFQMTPEYPPRLVRILSSSAVALLALWSLVTCGANGPDWDSVVDGLGILLVAVYAVFAFTTLWLQHRRRRRLPDVTLWYWRAGMSMLLAALALWLAGTLLPWLAAQRYYPLLLGVWLIGGFTTAVISGMLYKIVPFLGWLHLHAQLHTKAERRTRLPNMKDFIPERMARRQFHAYLLALASMTAAVIWPAGFAYVGAFAWLASCTLLWLNILNAVRLYRRLAK